MNSDKIKFGIACSLAGSFLIYSGILYSSLPAVDHPQSALKGKLYGSNIIAEPATRYMD
jgi:hypothetical protein